MDNKIVLCVGDSLGMPRENVAYKSSWFYLLSIAKNNYHFVHNFRRAFTTDMFSSKDFLENYNPNIVIMQVGIVDCAPRLFKSNSIFIKLVNRTPNFVNQLFWKVIKKYKKRSAENADVSLENFKLNLENFVERAIKINIEKIIIIKIQKPSSQMVNKNLLILDSIKKYNSVFDELNNKYNFITVINPLDFANENSFVLLPDGKPYAVSYTHLRAHETN
jgi:acyl-CoA thioesterase-1